MDVWKLLKFLDSNTFPKIKHDTATTVENCWKVNWVTGPHHIQAYELRLTSQMGINDSDEMIMCYAHSIW